MKSHQECYISRKRFTKNLQKIKITETIAIIQVNTEAQNIAFVIYDLMCPMKILQFLITVQIRIVILVYTDLFQF